MSRQATGIVYDPPAPGYPYIAVVLCEGEVLTSKAVSSVQEGEAMLAHVFAAYAETFKSQK